MATDKANLDTIFCAAIEMPSPDVRAAYIATACGTDSELRGRVEKLVAAHFRAGSFLETPSPDSPVTVDQPIREETGTMVGPYKLLEPIGEGGMGTVWMAQQSEPIKRLVAIKLIKAGMDSKQVLARFDAERQALALMDHPNIARVYDAGTTGEVGSRQSAVGSNDRDISSLPTAYCLLPTAGRPYFVMELVKGVPITKYCDDHHLTPRQRLKLFIPVCQAIQHAHQKGIIHRDIKPSNVLVAKYDDRPVPKVIDFGVAKATGVQLTEATLHTGFGAVVGTIEYMSPEQASFNQLDVDTRSDIYSLGVLLYELLAGSPPFTKKDLEKAGMMEMLRIIREQEPSKPSTKLSSSDALPSLSASRGTEPSRLPRLVQGELDWIVMKALEKDRSRRYETANGFAADVQRYLADEPVQACPPSAGYRLRKFVRRNKATVAVAGLVLFFFLLLGSGIGWVARDREARLAKVAGQVKLILDEVEQLEREQKWAEALAAAKRAEATLAGAEADPEILERVRQVLADLEMVCRLEAIRLEGTAVREDPERLTTGDRKYAEAFAEYGVDVEKLTVEEAAQRIRSRTSIAPALVAALGDWAFVRGEKDVAGGRRLTAVAQVADPDLWRQRVREALVQKDWKSLKDLARSEEMLRQPPATLYLLGLALHDSGHSEGKAVLRHAQGQYPNDFWINFRLGIWLIGEGPSQTPHTEEGIGYMRAAVALRPQSVRPRRSLGIGLNILGRRDEAIASLRKAIELDPANANAHNSLGIALGESGKLNEAIACIQKALELHPNNSGFHSNLGYAHWSQKKLDEAIACFKKAIELNPKNAILHSNLGAALAAQGKLDEAIACAKKAIELNPKYAKAHRNLGSALMRQGKLDDAVVSFHKAIELEPNTANPRVSLGIALVRLGKLNDAIASYRKAVELDPNNFLAQINFGLALNEQGKLDEAVACFQKAVELDPKNFDAQIRLGFALKDQGKLHEAVACFQKAVELDPKNVGAQINLGVGLQRLSKYREAITCFKKAIELDAKDALAHNNLAWVLANSAEPHRCDLAQAVALAKRAVELAPEDGSFWDTLGVAHYRAGEWKAALAVLEKSMELKDSASNGFRFLFLAMAHWQLGNKIEARQWYDRAEAWLTKNKTENEAEQRRFRDEARELLGIKEKPNQKKD